MLGFCWGCIFWATWLEEGPGWSFPLGAFCRGDTGDTACATLDELGPPGALITLPDDCFPALTLALSVLPPAVFVIPERSAIVHPIRGVRMVNEGERVARGSIML